LAEIFGKSPGAYQRGINRIVERAHELAKKDKWPLKKLAGSKAGPAAKKAAR